MRKRNAFAVAIAMAGLVALADAVRPYEFEWAGRDADEFPPVCRLETADGWRVETSNAEATLETGTNRALFGKSVVRLRHCGKGKSPTVRLLAPRPVPVPDGFDTASLWVFGNNVFGRENYASKTLIPSVVITANFIGPDGKTFDLSLGLVRHRGWHLQTGVVTNGVGGSWTAPAGSSFVGFTVKGGTNAEMRQIDLTSFSAFRDPKRPIDIAPRAKRGVQIFQEEPQGLNVGKGRLPFPNRKDTVIPPAAKLSKELEFRLPKDPLVWDDLAFRYGGGEWIPLAKGGGLFPREAAKGACVEFRRCGNSLVCDIARPEPGVESVRCGAGEFPAGTKAYRWPFWTGRWMGQSTNPATPPMFCGGIFPKTAVMKAGDSTLLVSAFFDWTQSNASSPIGGKLAPTNRIQMCAGTFYLPKTDGKLNGCFERFVWTFAERAEDVFPAIPNPPSPYRKETASGSWTSCGARDREKDAAYWRAVKAAGMDNVIVTDHEVGWRDEDESFTFRTRPAPKKGGDEGQRRYARIMIDELGFRYGPYNNFTDFAPVNAHWSIDYASRFGDGTLAPAWHRCYAPKPTWAVGMCERLTPEIQAKFNFNTAYCDVHTCVTPWSRTDYDARSPGAGTFAQVFYAFGEILLLQRANWRGPVYSEGGIQWIYSGLADGNYGQDDYPFFDLPWLVDFDLKRIHPLSNNFGMGMPSMFYGKRDAEFRAKDRDIWLERFIAATLAFGHSGYLISHRNPADLSIERDSYFPVQAIAERYCQADAVEILYGGADGRLHGTEEALANGDVAMNHIRVTYSDGTVVAVNGSMEGEFRVDVLGEERVLPANGWYAQTRDGKVVTYCIERDGQRIRYANAPGYREPYMRSRAVLPAGGAVPYRHVMVRDFRTVKDGKVIVFNIGTAAHCPGTLAALKARWPGVKFSVWADAPLVPELAEMMARRFPDVEIFTGADVPRTDADLLLVSSGSGIAGSVRKSIEAWRAQKGDKAPVAAYAIGYPRNAKPLIETFDFCFFRDRQALERAVADSAVPKVHGFAPDVVFDFDAADDAGAAALLKEHGLEPGKFVCAIPGHRYTPSYRMDPKKVATNESRELPDNAIVCAAIVEAVRRHGMKALLCAEQRSEMPLLTRALYDKLPQDVKDRCVVLRQFWAPDLALGVYRRSRCVFGIEMHSQVMALGSGIPACVFRHSGFGSKSGMWSDLGADCWLLDIDTPGAAEKAAAMVGGILADPDKVAAKCRAVRKEIDKAELAAARVVGGR